MTNPIALGPRRELFVDHHLIEDLNGVALKLHPPTRREVVFQVSQPWDNACTACYNLTQVDGRVLMYYRGHYPIKEEYADAAASQTTNCTGLNGGRSDLLIAQHAKQFAKADDRFIKQRR